MSKSFKKRSSKSRVNTEWKRTRSKVKNIIRNKDYDEIDDVLMPDELLVKQNNIDNE